MSLPKTERHGGPGTGSSVLSLRTSGLIVTHTQKVHLSSSQVLRPTCGMSAFGVIVFLQSVVKSNLAAYAEGLPRIPVHFLLYPLCFLS